MTNDHPNTSAALLGMRIGIRLAMATSRSTDITAHIAVMPTSDRPAATAASFAGTVDRTDAGGTSYAEALDYYGRRYGSSRIAQFFAARDARAAAGGAK